MFAGKSTIITGANKNLGKETAREFAKEGSNVLLHYHSSPDGVEDFANELSDKYGVKTVVFQGDLSDEETTIELFDTAITQFGSVDYAINNAGMIMHKNLSDVSIDEYTKMFDVNVKASFLFLREAEKKLTEKGSVVMITTSLLAGYTTGFSIYQAAKSAVYWMTKTASKETKRKITFNCISPGPMDTPFLYCEGTNEGVIEYLKSQTIEGRLTLIEDIVPIIKFIVKDGKWMTGQNLFANNGLFAP
ncbi:hypothetical protein CANINC_000656 [Pichia inconspicua]|uniref:Uncharacterized protein n=1 Tax=Pichia inconspicua TaxID=52247 RepID=A0A4V4NG62_9ASCO|nr:hypothetical protein CANINC_000656 [[Candida] inconspicua]